MMLVQVFNFLGEIASCGVSDFAYSYPFLCIVVWCLSVICHIRAPCLNHLTDFRASWQVHLWGPLRYCVRLGSLTPQR